MHSDADRERAAGGNDLAQRELVSVHRKNRDAVAAHVDRVKEIVEGS